MMFKNIFCKFTPATVAAFVLLSFLLTSVTVYANEKASEKALPFPEREYYKRLEKANKERQSKSDYALLYYDAVKNRVEQFTVPGEVFVDAEMVDFHMDGTYELVAYFASTDSPRPYARVMVYPAEGLLPVKDNITPEVINPIWNMQFSTIYDQDVYITEYNGRPALARSRVSFGYVQLYWVDEDNTVMEAVIRENGVLDYESNRKFLCVEGLINTYIDDGSVLNNTELREKYTVTDDVYYNATKPTSTWGIKANDEWRYENQFPVDVSKKGVLNIEVRHAERLLEYIAG